MRPSALIGLLAAFFVVCNVNAAMSVLDIAPPTARNQSDLNVYPVSTGTPLPDVSGYRPNPTTIPLAPSTVPVGSNIQRLDIYDNAKNALNFAAGKNTNDNATPPGWSGPHSPPVSQSQVTGYKNGSNSYVFATPDLACQDPAIGYLSTTNVYKNSQQVNSNTWACYAYNVNNPSSSVNYAAVTTALYCAAGYSLVGGKCTLTGQAQWPSDGTPTYNIGYDTNGKLQYNPDGYDPDNTGLTPTQRYERTGNDKYGNPIDESIQPNTGGGMDYQRQIQSQDPNTGQPTVTKDIISTDQNGNVVNSTTTTYNNSTVNNVTGSPITVNNTTPTVVVSAGAGQSLDTTGLARDTTAQQTNSKLDQLHKDLTSKDSTPMPIESDTPATFSQSSQKVINEIGNKLGSINIATGGATCPMFKFTIAYFNKDYQFDQLCTLDDSIRPTISSVMTVVWTVLAFFIFMRA